MMIHVRLYDCVAGWQKSHKKMRRTNCTVRKDSHEAEVLESRAKTLRGKAHRLQQGIHGVIAAWLTSDALSHMCLHFFRFVYIVFVSLSLYFRFSPNMFVVLCAGAYCFLKEWVCQEEFHLVWPRV